MINKGPGGQISGAAKTDLKIDFGSEMQKWKNDENEKMKK